MKRDTPGIRDISEHASGGCIRYEFGFVEGRELEALASLVAQLTDGDELSVPDWKFDGSFELRRSGAHFEAKNGRHGSSGEWRRITDEESVTWLLPGARDSAKQPRIGRGVLIRAGRR